jgi:hypothetical protein
LWCGEIVVVRGERELAGACDEVIKPNRLSGVSLPYCTNAASVRSLKFAAVLNQSSIVRANYRAGIPMVP